MDFSLPRGNKLLFRGSTLPRHLAKYAVPRAQCVYKQFRSGELVTQLIPGSDYSIWVHWFFIKMTQRFIATTRVDILALNYMLKGKADCILQGFGPLTLNEDTYQLVFVPGQVANEAAFGPGVHHCAHINFHPSKLATIAEQYPVFHPMLEQAQQKLKGATLGHAFISDYMHNLVQEIIHCDLGVAEREFFIESSIRDLLRFYVHDQGTKPESTALTGRQKKILHLVQSYISANLDKDLGTARLASLAGVARSWLHELFKRHYMKPVHRVVMELRLEEGCPTFDNNRSFDQRHPATRYAEFILAFLRLVQETVQDVAIGVPQNA